MADKLDILLRLDLDDKSLAEVKGKIQSITKETAKVSPKVKSGIQETTKSVETLGNTFVSSFKKFTLWLGVSTVFFQIARSIQFGIETIKELDSAIVELRRVTSSTEQEIEYFTASAFEMAKEIGATADEVIRATSSFSRMGFELSEASQLAESALILKNIGDGVDTIEESTAALIATLKGFRFEAEQSTKIIDSLNEVSNNFALDTGDLAEGIRRVSGTLNMTNTSFDETLGLLTGGIEVLQNTEKVSSGLITVSQRLRGISEEGEDLKPKLEDAFQSLFGTSIMDAQGNLKSTFELLEIMATRTDELTDAQKQYIFELSAGKRQVPVLQAIVSNWESVKEATLASVNSTGSARKEQEIFLDSIQGRYQTTIAQIQEFWSTLINSDAIKIAVTTFGNLVELLTDVNKTFGGMPIIIFAIIEALSLLKGTQITKFFSGLITTLVQSTQTMAGMKITTDSLTVSMGALQASLGIIGIAIVAVATATQNYKREIEDARIAQEKFAKSNEELNEIIKEGTSIQIENRIEALEGLSTQYALLSMRLGQLKLAQNDFDTSSDDGIDKLMQNRRAQKELEQQIELVENALGGLGTTGSNVFNRLEELRQKAAELKQEEKELEDSTYESTESFKEQLKVLSDLEVAYRNLSHEIDINREFLSRLDDSDESRIPLLKQLIEQYKEQQNVLHELANAEREAQSSGRLNAQQMQESQALVQKYGREWQSLESTIISYSKEIEQIPIDNYNKKLEEQAEELKKQNDLLKQQQQAIDDLVDITEKLIEQEKKDKIDALKEQISEYEEIINLKKESLRLTEEETDYQEDLSDKQSEISNIQSKILELSLDDSRSAQAEKTKLEEELANKTTELAEFQRERSLELQENALDKELENYKTEKEEEIDTLEDYLSQAGKVTADAMKMINNNIQDESSSLYQSLIEWNKKYGTSIEEDIVNTWQKAKEAMKSVGASSVSGASSQISSTIEKAQEEIESPKVVLVRYIPTGQVGTIHRNTYEKDKENFELLSSYDTGGVILNDQIAKIHANETILNPTQTANITDALGISTGSALANAKNLFSLSNMKFPTMSNTNSMSLKVDFQNLLTINGNPDSSTVANLQSLAVDAADLASKQIYESFMKMGYGRGVSSFSR